jgi:hypothetical protein
MSQNISLINQLEWQLGWKKVRRFATSALLALSLASASTPVFAQQQGQETFTSPEYAGHAIFAAMKSPDDREFLAILGGAGDDIVSSGDPIEDLDARSNFIHKYEEMHRFVTERNGTVTLIVGAENWPFPIPLVKKSGAWYFDTPAGKDEILFRRIGRNELAAIQACSDLVDSEKQYYLRAPDGFVKEYARKLVSDEGKHNGLYWEGADDQFDSPINPLIAYARQNRPADQVGAHDPFNGYFFRILTVQGPHAPGGAKNYVVNGKMTAGFAFIAYPAEYRSSGVMSFIVNQSGTIYEKDLGPDSTGIAEAMTTFDPDSTWHKSE